MTTVTLILVAICALALLQTTALPVSKNDRSKRDIQEMNTDDNGGSPKLTHNLERVNPKVPLSRVRSVGNNVLKGNRLIQKAAGQTRNGKHRVPAELAPKVQTRDIRNLDNIVRVGDRHRRHQL